MHPRRYKMTLAYDGSGFHGWQKQEPPGQEPLRTVQGEVEAVLVRLLRTPRTELRLKGASRTDTGVHAKGQVAQFDAASPIPIERMFKAIRDRLPDDIDIRGLEYAADDFEAIGGARHKQYRYRIWNTPEKPIGFGHSVYHGWVDLDAERMRHAAARIVGKHDFEGFATAGHGRDDTVRTVFRCDIEQHGHEIVMIIEGDGFLYNMVRIIVGTLFEVGRGKMDPAHIDRILKTADRRLAGPTLGPEGLCLEWISYDEREGHLDD